MFAYLLLLVTIHLVADFPLQTNAVFRLKMQSIPGTVPHGLIVLGTGWVLLWLCAPELGIRGALIYSLLAFAHFLQDLLKVRYWDKRGGSILIGYIGDQILHGIAALAAAYAFAAIAPPAFPLFPLVALSLLIAATYGYDTTRHIFRIRSGYRGPLERDLLGMAVRGLAVLLCLAVYALTAGYQLRITF